MIKAHVLIKGRVQGVWFRENTKEKAKELELKGIVRNKLNGDVEAIFEGPKDKIEEMIEWCKKGPPHARVDDVEVKFEKYKGEYETFSIVI